MASRYSVSRYAVRDVNTKKVKLCSSKKCLYYQAYNIECLRNADTLIRDQTLCYAISDGPPKIPCYAVLMVEQGLPNAMLCSAKN